MSAQRCAPPSFSSRMSREPRLAGKVAVISGASRGFGQAIAVRFVEEGAKVVCLSRSGCDETLSQIAQIDGLDKDVSAVAISVKRDISNESNIQRMYQSMADVFGDKLHILVNNFMRPLRIAASSKKPPITHDDVGSIFLNRWVA